MKEEEDMGSCTQVEDLASVIRENRVPTCLARQDVESTCIREGTSLLKSLSIYCVMESGE